MDQYRDENGFIKIDNILDENLSKNSYRFVFMYDNKKYYFKRISDKERIYNELIAQEIANEYGLKCANYDLASYGDVKGVISENFIKDDDIYIPMKDLLTGYYSDYGNNHNNLIDIIGALEFRYKDASLVGKLIDQVVDIFIFDVLIANVDRHSENYGVIENKEGVSISPVFDNNFMLSDLTLMYGGYSLGVDEDDDFFADHYDPNNKFLIKFIKISSNEYVELLRDKLKIISEENIEKILKKVENKIHSKIDEDIKDTIKIFFRINLDNINYVLDEVKERTI